MDDKALLYLHLPKCGGTTLNRVIEWEYNPLRIYSIDPSFFRWSYYKLGKWPKERLAKMRVFKGHMPFGLHRILPQPATYITVLREPVERVISEYYFAKHYRLHPQHRRMQSLSLEEYSMTTPHHNLQCKLLAGLPGPRDFLDGDCSELHLETAKQNVANHFSLAGLTGRFEETLALLKLIFGWKISHYASFNVTKVRPRKESVPQSTLDLIAGRNKWDVAIYNHLVPIFEHKLQSYGEAVQRELDEIRRAKSLRLSGTGLYVAASTIRKGVSRLYSAI